MPKSILIIKIFIIFLFALHPNAWALDFQLGVGALDISKSDETSKESTFFPFVGLGGEMDSQLSVFLEVGTCSDHSWRGMVIFLTGKADLCSIEDCWY